MPRPPNTHNVQILVPKRLLQTIRHHIADGRHRSVSAFFRAAAIAQLEREREAGTIEEDT